MPQGPHPRQAPKFASPPQFPHTPQKRSQGTPFPKRESHHLFPSFPPLFPAKRGRRRAGPFSLTRGEPSGGVGNKWCPRKRRNGGSHRRFPVPQRGNARKMVRRGRECPFHALKRCSIFFWTISAPFSAPRSEGTEGAPAPPKNGGGENVPCKRLIQDRIERIGRKGIQQLVVSQVGPPFHDRTPNPVVRKQRAGRQTWITILFDLFTNLFCENSGVTFFFPPHQPCFGPKVFAYVLLVFGPPLYRQKPKKCGLCGFEKGWLFYERRGLRVLFPSGKCLQRKTA